MCACVRGEGVFWRWRDWKSWAAGGRGPPSGREAPRAVRAVAPAGGRESRGDEGGHLPLPPSGGQSPRSAGENVQPYDPSFQETEPPKLAVNSLRFTPHGEAAGSRAHFPAPGVASAERRGAGPPFGSGRPASPGAVGLRRPDSLLVRGSRINKYEFLCPGCERTPAGPIAAGARPVPGTAACRVCRPGRGEPSRRGTSQAGVRRGEGGSCGDQTRIKRRASAERRLPGTPEPLWLGEAIRSPSGTPAAGGAGGAGLAALGRSVTGPGGRGRSRRSEAWRGCPGSGPRHSACPGPARRELAPSSPLAVAPGGRCSRARSGVCSPARTEGTHTGDSVLI